MKSYTYCKSRTEFLRESERCHVRIGNQRGAFRAERAVLKLMYAALILASQRWRRMLINKFEKRQIEESRRKIARLQSYLRRLVFEFTAEGSLD